MLSTNNFGLQKPEPLVDNVNIDVINENMDIIDKGLVIYLGTTSGSNNAYTITSDAIKDLTEGTAICIKIHTASTAASTLNINNWSAKAIKKTGGSDVTNLKAGIYTLRYDGTNFILQGEGASGNATASDLLLDKTATTDAGEIIGTMSNNGPAASETINLTVEGAEYIIPKGYHSGLRKIKAVITGLVASVIKAGVTVGGIIGTFTADATAAAANILSGKTAYVNGNKVTGTMPNNGAVNQALPINGSYAIPAGYHNGNGLITQSIPTKKAAVYTPGTSNQIITAGQYLEESQLIAGDAELVSGNIRAGVNLFGVAGNPNVIATDTSMGAFADQVLAGRACFVNGQVVMGSMPNNGNKYTPASMVNGWDTLGRIYVLPPKGYYDGLYSITCDDPNYIASNIRAGISVFGLVGTMQEGVNFATGVKTAYDGTVYAKYHILGSQYASQGSLTYIQISGLGFTPSAVEITTSNTDWCLSISKNTIRPDRYCIPLNQGSSPLLVRPDTVDGNITFAITADGFLLPTPYLTTNVSLTWKAWE